MKRLVVCLVLLALTPGAHAAPEWLSVEGSWELPFNLQAAEHGTNAAYSGGVAGQLALGPQDNARCQGAQFDLRIDENSFKFFEEQETTGCGYMQFSFMAPEGATEFEISFRVNRPIESRGNDFQPHFLQELHLLRHVDDAWELAATQEIFRPKDSSQQSKDFQATLPIEEGAWAVQWRFADLGAFDPEGLAGSALPVSRHAFQSDVSTVSLRFPGIEIPQSIAGRSILGTAANGVEETVELTIPEQAGYQLGLTLTHPVDRPLSGFEKIGGGPLDDSAWPSSRVEGQVTTFVPASVLEPGASYELRFTQTTTFTTNPGVAFVSASLALAMAGTFAWTSHSLVKVRRDLDVRDASFIKYGWLALGAIAAFTIVGVVGIAWQGAWNLFVQSPLGFDSLAFLAFMGAAIVTMVLARHVVLRARQEAIHKAQLESSNRDLEVFSHIVSHDLRAPLRTISAFTGLLGKWRPNDMPREVQEYIGYAQAGTARMAKLLDSLGEYSRMGQGPLRLQNVELSEVAKGVRDDLAHDLDAAGAKIRIGALPKARVEPTLIGELLLNLCQNAVKFRHPKRSPVVRIAGQSSPTGVVLTVSDNGIGLQAGQERIIFEPFQRGTVEAKTPGTGMGLAICRRVAERHGGTLTVESSEGRGTTFTLRLPISS